MGCPYYPDDWSVADEVRSGIDDERVELDDGDAWDRAYEAWKDDGGWTP